MLPASDFPANAEVRRPILKTKSEICADVTLSNFGPSEPSRAYILAPSDGIGNDAMRAKNGGSRMGFSPLALLNLERSASEPVLRGSEKKSRSRLANLGRLAMSEPSSPLLSPKTPRTMRGSCRQASVLPISVRTVMHSRKSITSVDTSVGYPSGSEPASPSSEPASPSNSRKCVSFANLDAPKAVSEYLETRTAAGERKVALSRSKSLMSSLYDLRRVAPTAEKTKGQEVTLMTATLSDFMDTETQLRATEAILVNSHEPITEFGGTRFATAVMSQRTLAVVQRKAALLYTAESRAKEFEDAHSKKEELCEALLEQESLIPETFVGMKKFIAGLIHKDGNPVDADKSNFELFAATFGLPAKHQAVTTLKGFENAAVEWWAWRTLKEAQCGASSDAIRRMITVVLAVCGDQHHPALVQVETLLVARLAEKVLQHAEKMEARDGSTVALSAVPQPASAREAADSIREELRNAVGLGASAKHPMMERAKGIEVVLRMEEKNRLAAKVLLAAKASQEEDERAAAAGAPSVAPVGPATERAENIESTIHFAVSKDGVQESHPAVQEAKNIAKTLRDLDGDRKRLAAREKRLGKTAVAM